MYIYIHTYIIYKYICASLGCRNLSTYKGRIRLYAYICSTYLYSLYVHFHNSFGTTHSVYVYI